MSTVKRYCGYDIHHQEHPRGAYVSYDDYCELLRSAGGHLGRFTIGTRVRKTKGSSWQGRIVGTYSTTLTPEGYAVESEAHPGSVQIYPSTALEIVP